MKRTLRNLAFFLTHFIFAVSIRFIFKIESNGNSLAIFKEKKYIIAANHPSKLDPFLLLAGLPLKTFMKFLPFAFLTTEDYLKKWNYKPFLLMWGCISNKEKNRVKPLQKLKTRLENNETIFIFPRGELEKKGNLSSPRVGAVYLEREVKDSLILPVKITISNKITLVNLIKRKVKVKIEFKKIFRHEKFEKDLQPLADDLMNKITS